MSDMQATVPASVFPCPGGGFFSQGGVLPHSRSSGKAASSGGAQICCGKLTSRLAGNDTSARQGLAHQSGRYRGSMQRSGHAETDAVIAGFKGPLRRSEALTPTEYDHCGTHTYGLHDISTEHQWGLLAQMKMGSWERCDDPLGLQKGVPARSEESHDATTSSSVTVDVAKNTKITDACSIRVPNKESLSIMPHNPESIFVLHPHPPYHSLG